MVYSANNEQRMEFRVHNTVWQPVDFEGLTLMLQPAAGQAVRAAGAPPSKASVRQMVQKKQSARNKAGKAAGYVVIDLETTGLDAEKDEILKVGAVRVIHQQPAETFSALVCPRGSIPEAVSGLTGITAEMAAREGKKIDEVLKALWDFVGQSPVVGHNLDFDLAFLKKESARAGLSMPAVGCRDTLTLARRNIRDCADYRLETLAAYFDIQQETAHRALADCMTTFRIFEKLNEI